MKNTYIVFLIAFIIVIVLGYATYKATKSRNMTQISQQSGTKIIKVVAAENFYGDLVKQLGGSHVSVLSILSDPNVDPHEYESNVQDGIAISKANFIIKNGSDYDTWMDKLLSASPNKNRIVLTASDIADHTLPDNPHVWYGIDTIQTIAAKITDTLKKVDSADSSEFDQNLVKFTNSLNPIRQKMNDIKTNFSGTPVALTETIYLYQTEPLGLNVLTPFAFEKAIAEGNDPSADDVAKANDQISNKQVKVFIYNEQTVTPITTNLQNLAKKNSIPIVPVTETMPKDKIYQSWMIDQLNNLQNALQSTK